MRTSRRLAAVLAALAVALVSCAGEEPTAAPAIPAATMQALEGGDWDWQPQAEKLELGVTHTRYSLGGDEPAQARDRGVEVLSRNEGMLQNHHLMGFGTLSPEESPDEYDWSSLDDRMELTEETGGRSMLTLCCAPDWMKGGEAGDTDWDLLEDNPLPEYYDDYAELAAEAVQRYPQVGRVMVWNELKGFYNHAENRWDYEGYTEFYNKVYRAVKQVRPDVAVGGPYVVLISLDPGSADSSDVEGPWGVADQRTLDVIDYWLRHKAGADFMVVDAGTKTRQDTYPESATEGAQKFADLTAWLRERSDLPIWWAEFYPEAPEGEQGGPSSPASAVATLAAVAAYAEAGSSGALLWGPQGHHLDHAALWTDSTEPGGGLTTPLTESWQWLVPRLAEGKVEIGRSATRPLLAFRAPDGLLVVNLSGEQVQVTPDTEPVPGWAATLSSRAPGS